MNVLKNATLSLIALMTLPAHAFNEVNLTCDSSKDYSEVSTLKLSVKKVGARFQAKMTGEGHQIECQRLSQGYECYDIPNSDFKIESALYDFSSCSFEGPADFKGKPLFALSCHRYGVESNHFFDTLSLASNILGVQSLSYAVKVDHQDIAKEPNSYFQYNEDTIYGDVQETHPLLNFTSFDCQVSVK